MKIWEIECEELCIKSRVKANSDYEMVTVLLEKGFKRVLKGDVPYADEPLYYIDKKGRTWDAMPESVKPCADVKVLPHMDEISKRTGDEK